MGGVWWALSAIHGSAVDRRVPSLHSREDFGPGANRCRPCIEKGGKLHAEARAHRRSSLLVDPSRSTATKRRIQTPHIALQRHAWLV